MIRAAALFFVLFCGIFGVLWLALTTPYLKSKARVRRIVRNLALTTGAGILTTVTIIGIYIAEHSI